MQQAGEPHIMNADGFGMGWYDRSTMTCRLYFAPFNLFGISKPKSYSQQNKIQYFVGIRAATVGDINTIVILFSIMI